MTSYNPYRNSFNHQSFIDQRDINYDYVQDSPVERGNSIMKNRSLIKLSMFGRNYNEFAYKNAKLVHSMEDPNAIDRFSYKGLKSKLNALAQDGTNVASLQTEYQYKAGLFSRYAKEPQINYYIDKMANEIISYTKDNFFCTLETLDDEKYSEQVIQRAKQVFIDTYNLLGFNKQSKAYDICFDYLVEGYITFEIVYDDKRRNITAFQPVDPSTVYPIIDDETGIKLWVQNAENNQGIEPRVILDSDLIYIAYSGSSKYTDSSYVEPLIRPYNELKGLERTRIIFNIINSTMHKNINVPMGDIPKHLQEQELLSLISLYKDNIEFDNYEGLAYINGSKDLPYSKEAWFIDNGNGGVKIDTEAYNGNDLNEDITLNWFRNNFKEATRFPLNKLDQSSGGGSIYNFGSEVTYDDFTFEKFVNRLKTQFAYILIKPIYTQLILEFPKLIDSNLKNDLNITFFSNDEIVLAKKLSNLQAKISIAADLTSNFKGADDDKPYLHPRLIAERILKLDKELLKLNDQYWKKYADAGASEGGGDFDGDDDFGGDDFGGDDFGGENDFESNDTGGDDFESDDTGEDDTDTE